MNVILDLVIPKVIDLYENEGVDIIDPDWMDKLRMYTEKINAEVNRFAFLDDPDLCPALRPVGDYFMCVWGRPEGPPNSRKVAKITDTKGAAQHCLGCKKTREIREGIAGYEETIRTLKDKAKNGIVVPFPRCRDGGVLNDDGLSFWCRRQMKNVKVSKCKTLRKVIGQPCKDLYWTKIPLKGELPDDTK